MAIPDRLKQNLAASWLSHVVAMAIGLVLMPFVLHTLGDMLYGTWIFINSFATYSGLLYLGMGHMIAKFVASHHAREEWDELNEAVSVVFFIYLAMGALCVLIAAAVAFVAPYIGDWGDIPAWELRAVIVLLGVNVGFGMASSAFGGVLVGVQRYDIVRAFGVAAGLVRLGLTLVFLTSEWGLLTLSLIYLAVTLTENIGPIAYAYMKVPTLSVRLKHFKRERLKECFSFSFFTFLENIASNMIYATDAIVIGIVLGAKAVVPYFIASRLCDFIKKPIHQIGFVSMPQAGALHATGEQSELQRLLLRSSALAVLLTSGFFVGSWFFGDNVIRAWVGDGYAQSHVLLLIILGTQLVALPSEVLRLVLMGTGRVKVPCLLFFLTAVLNVGLTLLLIGPYSLRGVAVGTLVPVVCVELFLLLPYGLRHLQLGAVQYFRAVAAPCVVPVAALLGYCLLVLEAAPRPEGWLALGLVSAGGGAVLIGTWFAQRAVLVSRRAPDNPTVVEPDAIAEPSVPPSLIDTP